jgi:hypothetical protein
MGCSVTSFRTTKDTIGLSNVTNDKQVKATTSVTDNAVVRFDTTDGSIIQNSSLLVDDVGAIVSPQIATPTNPSASTNKLYFKSDDKLYKLTSGGVESEVGGGSADAFTVKASSGDVSPNYLDGKVAKSIVVTSNKLELSGDSASPGNNKAYGTSHAGTLGYYDNNVDDVKRQAILDGRFQIAQFNPAGSTTNPATGTYPIFDMWKVEYNAGGGTLPANIIHQQNVQNYGVIEDCRYTYNVQPDGAGSGFGATSYYRISNYSYKGTRDLAGLGNTVTLRLSHSTGITGTKKMGIRLIQNYGTGGSPNADEVITGTNFTVTTSNAWGETIFTFTLNTISGKTFGTNNDDYLKLEIYYMWGSDYNTSLGGASAETFVGSGRIQISRIQLNAGSIALPFLVKPFEKELEDCRRWYKKSYNYETAIGTSTLVGMVCSIQAVASTGPMGIHILFNPNFIRTPVGIFYDNSGNLGKCFKGAANQTAVDSNTGALGKGATRIDCTTGTSATEMYVHYIYDCRY